MADAATTVSRVLTNMPKHRAYPRVCHIKDLARGKTRISAIFRAATALIIRFVRAIVLAGDTWSAAWPRHGCAV